MVLEQAEAIEVKVDGNLQRSRGDKAEQESQEQELQLLKRKKLNRVIRKKRLVMFL